MGGMGLAWWLAGTALVMLIVAGLAVVELPKRSKVKRGIRVAKHLNMNGTGRDTDRRPRHQQRDVGVAKVNLNQDLEIAVRRWMDR